MKTIQGMKSEFNKEIEILKKTQAEMNTEMKNLTSQKPNHNKTVENLQTEWKIEY